MIGYCRICSFIVAGCSLLHFLLATASHPTVIDLEWDLFTQSSGAAQMWRLWRSLYLSRATCLHSMCISCWWMMIMRAKLMILITSQTMSSLLSLMVPIRSID